MTGRFIATVFLMLAWLTPMRAEGVDAPSEIAVAATVGDEPISTAEAEQFLARSLRGKKVGPELLPLARAGALEEIVLRRLVLAYAQRMGDEPSPQELTRAAAAMESRLAAQRRTIDDWLKTESITRLDLDRRFAWNLVWEKYRARYLAPERREAYFLAHRRELDGTQLEVSHILLRAASDAGSRVGDALVEQALAIRREIASGRVPFAEAARAHSAGPSRASGGRLGFIGRHGPMDETFSRAAFALAVGETSPPVRTPFGVHLIHCDACRAGGKRLADVGPEVDEALSRELIEKLARLQRQRMPVKYTTAWPHFKPGTCELAE